jgi:hypothetical protein
MKTELADMAPKTQSEMQGDLRGLFRGAAKVVLELLLEELVQEIVGAGRYARADRRRRALRTG